MGCFQLNSSVAVCKHETLTWLYQGVHTALCSPVDLPLGLCCWGSLKAEPSQGIAGAGDRKAYLETSSHVFFRRWMALLCRAERMA